MPGPHRMAPFYGFFLPVAPPGGGGGGTTPLPALQPVNVNEAVAVTELRDARPYTAAAPQCVVSGIRTCARTFPAPSALATPRNRSNGLPPVRT